MEPGGTGEGRVVTRRGVKRREVKSRFGVKE